MMLPLTSNAAFSLFLVTAMQQQCIKCNGMGKSLTNGAKDMCDFNDENKNINAYIFMIKNSRGKKVTTKFLFICDQIIREAIHFQPMGKSSLIFLTISSNYVGAYCLSNFFILQLQLRDTR